MEIAFFILLNGFGHLCYVGSRMTTSLFALELGASAVTVGMLVASFAVLPMLLSVFAGRFIDRIQQPPDRHHPPVDEERPCHDWFHTRERV